MFVKGISKLGGRQRGTPNKLTRNFREAVLFAHENIGRHEAFSKWAAQNPTEYYRIAARLIPTETKNRHEEKVVVILPKPTDHQNCKVLNSPQELTTDT